MYGTATLPYSVWEMHTALGMYLLHLQGCGFCHLGGGIAIWFAQHRSMLKARGSQKRHGNRTGIDGGCLGRGEARTVIRLVEWRKRERWRRGCGEGWQRGADVGSRETMTDKSPRQLRYHQSGVGGDLQIFCSDSKANRDLMMFAALSPSLPASTAAWAEQILMKRKLLL